MRRLRQRELTTMAVALVVCALVLLVAFLM
jgi:hypothetical protein